MTSYIGTYSYTSRWSTVTSLELELLLVELMLDMDKVCLREEPQLHNLRSQGIRGWLRNALMLTLIGSLLNGDDTGEGLCTRHGGKGPSTVFPTTTERCSNLVLYLKG